MSELDDMTEPELFALMNRVGAAADIELPDGVVFIILAGEPNSRGIAQYVSNANRDDCIAWMRETATRLERREDVSR